MDDTTNGTGFFFPEEFVEKINNLTTHDFEIQLECFELLSHYFSIIPSCKYGKRVGQCKSPIEKYWQKYCFEKQAFDSKNFIGNNASITCGPASGILVLDINDIELFKKFLIKYKLNKYGVILLL